MHSGAKSDEKRSSIGVVLSSQSFYISKLMKPNDTIEETHFAHGCNCSITMFTGFECEHSCTVIMRSLTKRAAAQSAGPGLTVSRKRALTACMTHRPTLRPEHSVLHLHTWFD